MRRLPGILSLACAIPMMAIAQQQTSTMRPVMSGVHFTAVPVLVAAPHAVTVRSVVAPQYRGNPVRTGTRLAAPAPRSTTRPTGWNQLPTRRPANTFDPVFVKGNFIADGYPVPGLGFDYPHYFATHPNARHCDLCFSFGFSSGFVIPFMDGGIFLPMPVPPEQPATEQSADEGQGAQQPAQGEEPTQGEPSPPPARLRQQPAPAEQTEYVFVRRDGTLIFAVAYSWINDRLQYVTGEGLRRTVAASTLDLDATQQFNDQRGVPIRLPA